MTAPSLFWFRNDLRLTDNPALAAAIARGAPVIPVFIWAPEDEGDWPAGGATRWWQHHSLAELDSRLRVCGSRLTIRRGPASQIVPELARETGAQAVFWNRRYEPALTASDAQLKTDLKRLGLEVESHAANLLFEPWTIQTGGGTPFQVFTPFWRKCLAQPEPALPHPAPQALPAPAKWPTTIPLDQLELLPRIPWDSGLRQAWRPGEAGALDELQRFLKQGVADYPVERDRPDHVGTSRLSPYLHFGEIGPRQIWHAVREFARRTAPREGDTVGEPYLRQLVWREFAFHLLYHFPQTPTAPLREAFNAFPWQTNRRALQAWQRGQTGYPYIDAGMRELWHTGWMHNRVRMATASFLVKDLLISWQEGARWFWDTLVDADLANNTLGWQWTAGCGADAAPYFRVFNPVTQATKFDPEGVYVRRWVPELAKLPTKWLHQPWDAPRSVLADAGVSLGKNYPRPIVDHAEARTLALEALAQTQRDKAR
ncbi:MAG: deoxyribodipyrimidine photo-lyase [Planctomycetes bacterium]|nr:deoxyribodipyrimidine photo-lyase [Planctomycetota bacterium]